jgi:hypothetical protein
MCNRSRLFGVFLPFFELPCSWLEQMESSVMCVWAGLGICEQCSPVLLSMEWHGVVVVCAATLLIFCVPRKLLIFSCGILIRIVSFKLKPEQVTSWRALGLKVKTYPVCKWSINAFENIRLKPFPSCLPMPGARWVYLMFYASLVLYCPEFQPSTCSIFSWSDENVQKKTSCLSRNTNVAKKSATNPCWSQQISHHHTKFTKKVIECKQCGKTTFVATRTNICSIEATFVADVQNCCNI